LICADRADTNKTALAFERVTSPKGLFCMSKLPHMQKRKAPDSRFLLPASNCCLSFAVGSCGAPYELLESALFSTGTVWKIKLNAMAPAATRPAVIRKQVRKPNFPATAPIISALNIMPI
jgi:hypothetical protein